MTQGEIRYYYRIGWLSAEEYIDAIIKLVTR